MDFVCTCTMLTGREGSTASVKFALSNGFPSSHSYQTEEVTVIPVKLVPCHPQPSIEGKPVLTSLSQNQRSAFIFRSLGGKLSSILLEPESNGLCMGTGVGDSVGAKLCWYRSPVD